VGVVNVPIIKFSVYWWNSLHQTSSLFAKGGPSIADSMLWPLLIMIAAYWFYFGWVFLLRLKAEVLARRVQTKRVRMMGI
jgi:heme exporter protein C